MAKTMQRFLGGMQKSQLRIWGMLLVLGFLLVGCGAVTQDRPTTGEELTEEADIELANLGAVVARINAGGPAVTTGGVRWNADQYFSNGRSYSNSNVSSVANTSDNALYLRGRVPAANENGRISYSIPVPAKGQYIVRLHFAEIYWGSPGWGSRGGAGSRVFSVNLENGSANLRNYDIAADVGLRRAVVKSFEVTVNDGRLNIDFSANKDRPKVAAIEVFRKGSGSSSTTPSTGPSTPREPAPTPSTTTRSSNSNRNTSLRGNPNFSESQLSSEARTWYRRMWGFINNSNQMPNFKREASSGDVHNYGKSLNNYHTQLLAVFRLTGDLRILDEIAGNAERMLSTLRDTTRDGYQNWTFRNTGKDNRGMLDEVLTYSHVAALAYAFEVNRNLRSPNGINYGRLADRLLNHIRRDFEPKWRKRNNRANGFPFLRSTLSHPYTNWMRYHHYMFLLTGERGYRDYLDQMSRVAAREFKDINTSSGRAVVWDYRFTSDPVNFVSASDRLGLAPSLYAKYVYSAVLDLHLEGVAPFDRTFMQKMATTLSHFMLDGACLSNCGATTRFQIDIGAGKNQRTDDGTLLRTGYAQSRFKAPQYNHYGDWFFASYAAFDRGNKINRVNQAAYAAIERNRHERPARGSIPIGMVFSLLHK